jgi:K+ transporter
MKVAWSEPAVADLVAIYDYIARDSPHYAQRFVEKLVAAVEPLESFLWFIAVVVLGVVNSVHNYSVTGTFTPLFLFSLFHSGIWLTYLSISKRVKATCGATAGW